MSTEVEEGMEALSIPECERLLRAGRVGILAVSGAAAPLLRPVNFVHHQDWVLIRTGEGQIFEAAQASKPASFVTSEIDPREHTGWSVIVTGNLVETSGIASTAELPKPWARAEKHHFVGLAIDEISGRRIVAAEPRLAT